MPSTSPPNWLYGGGKGFSLAFLIDFLCGLLSGGASGTAVQPLYGDPSVPNDCSHLFIAVDVVHFGNPDVFRAAAAAAVHRIRNGKRAPGVTELYTPGEPEWRRFEGTPGFKSHRPSPKC